MVAGFPKPPRPEKMPGRAKATQTLKFRNLFCAPAKTDLFLSGLKGYVLISLDGVTKKMCFP